MISNPAAVVIAMTTMLLALTTFGLTATLIHLRRRHRAMRSTLARVREERDDARDALARLS